MNIGTMFRGLYQTGRRRVPEQSEHRRVAAKGAQHTSPRGHWNFWLRSPVLVRSTSILSEEGLDANSYTMLEEPGEES